MAWVKALVLVLTALVVSGALLRGLGWWRRRLALDGIRDEDVVRRATGVRMRVLVHGTRAVPGMGRRRASRTTGDLVLLRDRFVLATGQGVLADLRPDRGRRFSSARCTGPGRLVIEGDLPSPRGQPGLYRVEIAVPDAPEWARALRPWVREGAERFGSYEEPVS